MTNQTANLQQLQADTRSIVTEVERLTGLNSNWSGNLVLGTELNALGRPRYMGMKAWGCDIVLHQSLSLFADRHSTLIHEALHSVSVGLNELDYRAYKGYEEGVVEQCTRLLRIQIIANTSLPAQTHARTSYTIEVGLLETLRLQTHKTDTAFYLELLETPLRDREARLLQWIQTVETMKTLPQIAQETLSPRTGLKR